MQLQKKRRKQTSSVKSAYYNTAADQAVMTGDNQSGCVMVTTVDIIVQHPLDQDDPDCTTALHIAPTILLCLCYCR